MHPFIKFRVNLVAVLFVVGVFFSDSSRSTFIIDLLDRVVFSFFRSVVGVVAWRSWSTRLSTECNVGQLGTFLPIAFQDMNWATTHAMDNDREVR